MRLQRTTIENVGVRGIQLWHAAFKMMYIARVIMPPANPMRRRSESPIYALQMAMIPGSPPGSTLSTAEQTSTPTTPTPIDFSRQPIAGRETQHSLFPTSMNVQCTQRPGPDHDPNNLGNLPTYLWRHIFEFYAQARGILNSTQQNAVIAYARDRSNIAAEKQLQIKGESHRIWKALDAMNCLTYEMKLWKD